MSIVKCNVYRRIMGLLKRLVRGLWVRLPRKVQRFLVRRIEAKFLIAVVVIAVDEEGRLLCVRHVFRPRSYPWGLPSGFVDRGEEPAATAAREVLEETGYEIRVEQLLEAAMYLPDQLELVYRARLGRRIGGTGFESTGLGLFAPDALPAGLLPSNLHILHRHGFPEADMKPKRPGGSE